MIRACNMPFRVCGATEKLICAIRMSLALSVAMAGSLAQAGSLRSTSEFTVSDLAGAPSIIPKPALLLFWASWCGPCQQELAEIEAIADAAGKVPVIVIPIDRTARTRQMLQGKAKDKVRLVRGGGNALLQGLAGPSAALPVAVRTDAAGVACRIRRGALDPVQARAMARATC